MSERTIKRFAVVRNHLGRYAIWPTDEMSEMSAKWKPVGFEGDQREVRDYIREHWPELREWEDDDDDEFHTARLTASD